MDPNNQTPQASQPEQQSQFVPPVNQVPTQPTVSAPPTMPPQLVPASQDPGKTLGTLSVALFWLSLIATTLGIIGLIKSKKAGYKNTRAIIGIILSLIVFIISAVTVVRFLTSDSFKQAYCKDYPTDSTCKTVTSSTSDSNSASSNTDTSLKLYKSTALGFELKVPASWESNQIPYESTTQALQVRSGDPASGGLRRIDAVLAYCTPAKQTLTTAAFTAEFQQLYDGNVQSKIQGETYQPFKSFTVNGYPAVQLDYSNTEPGAEERHQDTAFLTKNGTTICHVGISDTNSELPGPAIFDKADEIVGSFKLL